VRDRSFEVLQPRLEGKTVRPIDLVIQLDDPLLQEFAERFGFLQRHLDLHRSSVAVAPAPDGQMVSTPSLEARCRIGSALQRVSSWQHLAICALHTILLWKERQGAGHCMRDQIHFFAIETPFRREVGLHRSIDFEVRVFANRDNGEVPLVPNLSLGQIGVQGPPQECRRYSSKPLRESAHVRYERPEGSSAEPSRAVECFSPGRFEADPVADVPSHDVTRLLARWKDGDEAALQQLLPIVHEELRTLARRRMAGERPGDTLQPTALVNEAYLRLVNLKQMQWQNRAHFLRWPPD
jgi:hypothetical protein